LRVAIFLAGGLTRASSFGEYCGIYIVTIVFLVLRRPVEDVVTVAAPPNSFARASIWSRYASASTPPSGGSTRRPPSLKEIATYRPLKPVGGLGLSRRKFLTLRMAAFVRAFFVKL